MIHLGAPQSIPLPWRAQELWGRFTVLALLKLAVLVCKKGHNTVCLCACLNRSGGWLPHFLCLNTLNPKRAFWWQFWSTPLITRSYKHLVMFFKVRKTTSVSADQDRAHHWSSAQWCPAGKPKKFWNHFSICACHPCAGAMLIFSVSFQF